MSASHSAPSFDRRKTLKTLGLGWLALQMPTPARAIGFAGSAEETRAMEVSEYIQKNYWDQRRNLYMDKPGKQDPTAIWGGGIVFSSLVAAARHDKKYLGLVRDYFRGLDSYWDSKTKIPGYEPVPTAGNANDKYFDDNAWMVLTFLEAYELTGDMKYLKRAKETLAFVLTGWDDKAGGGIWWHVAHKDDAKNTCINAPAALGCFKLSKFSDAKTAAQLIEQGKKIVDWTVKVLQAPNGLFMDNIKVSTGVINRGTLTYNSALMQRCFIWLHASTKKQEYLDQAVRIGKAAEGLLDGKTGAYRDPEKWSHLMVEADIEMFRHTKQIIYYTRAKKTCEFHYNKWKAKPDNEVIDVASVARELWLVADMETSVGKMFWEKADRVTK
ncbi:MAG: hypothetical protein JWO82_182 [Akkermansiaceae bacterium]|nr:hypothetical protein [Akkermansiaceae bacterium]